MIFYGYFSLKETTIGNDNQIIIYKIETVYGKVIDLRNKKIGYALLLNNNLVNIKSNGEQEIFPPSNVKKYYIEKFDFGKTFLLVIGSVLLLFFLAVGLFAIIIDGHGFGV